MKGTIGAHCSIVQVTNGQPHSDQIESIEFNRPISIVHHENWDRKASFGCFVLKFDPIEKETSLHTSLAPDHETEVWHQMDIIQKMSTTGLFQ